jgi:hypothetical protein
MYCRGISTKILHVDGQRQWLATQPSVTVLAHLIGIQEVGLDLQ